MEIKYGTSIELSYADNITVIYSGIKENVSLEKGDTVKEGDCIGYVGNTTNVENEDGTHVHVEAYKNDKAINPLSLLEYRIKFVAGDFSKIEESPVIFFAFFSYITIGLISREGRL